MLFVRGAHTNIIQWMLAANSLAITFVHVESSKNILQFNAQDSVLVKQLCSLHIETERNQPNGNSSI